MTRIPVSGSLPVLTLDGSPEPNRAVSFPEILSIFDIYDEIKDFWIEI